MLIMQILNFNLCGVKIETCMYFKWWVNIKLEIINFFLFLICYQRKKIFKILL